MTNLNNRLKKIKGAVDNLPGGSNEVMMFFRPDPYHPDNQTPAEIKWREENPSFRGKVHVFCFGAKNLGL
jgi:hypothetical protein